MLESQVTQKEKNECPMLTHIYGIEKNGTNEHSRDGTVDTVGEGEGGANYIQQRSVSRSVVSDSVPPADCSPPGSSVHGILQARTLEWGAISFSRGSSRPR